MALLDALLTTVETVTWRVRELGEVTAEALGSVQRGAEGASGQYADLSRELGRWKIRAARLSATTWMLGKLMASYRLFQTRAAFMPRKRIARAQEELHAANAERFYRCAVDQGGAFLKIGQMLSCRKDLLPEPWIERLSLLQDQAPAVDFDDVRAVLEADLGPLEGRFAQFDPEPIASASIGQVHRATTLDGIDVAVKVQRPDIQELMELDVTLLKLFFEGSRNHFPDMDHEVIADEVAAMLLLELDYVQEAKSVNEMAALFEGVPNVTVPKPLMELCGAHVLTTQFAPGRKFTEALDEMYAAHQASPEGGHHAQLSELLGNLLATYLRQVMQAGVFQADPHPGNLLADDEGTLVLLDFGCTKRLPETFRATYSQMLGAFMSRDTERLGELCMELGLKTRSGSADTLIALAEAAMTKFREAAETGELSWPTREELLADSAELMALFERDPIIHVPAELVMLGRVFSSLGGFFVHYQPTIDYTRHVLPHLQTGA